MAPPRAALPWVALLTALPTACTYQALRLSMPCEGTACDTSDSIGADADGDLDSADTHGQGDGVGDGGGSGSGDAQQPTDEPTATTDAVTPPCPDLEGADSLADAILLSVLEDGDLCRGDQDWYRVEAATGTVVRWTVTFDAVMPVAFELRDCSSGQPLPQCPTSSTTRNWFCEFVAPTSGGLCLGLTPGPASPATTVSYTIKATLNPAATCVIDRYEENDSEGMAYLFSNRPPISFDDGQLCTGDPDWFSFDTGGDEEALTFTLAGTGGASLILKVTDCVNSTPLPEVVCAPSSAGLPGPLCVALFDAPRSTYCLGALEGANLPLNGEAYSMAVGRHLYCGDDDGEPNNTRFNPRPSADVAGLTLALCELDADWFSIGPAPADGPATVTLTWFDPGQAVQVAGEWWVQGAPSLSSYCYNSIFVAGEERYRTCSFTVTQGSVHLLKVYIVAATSLATINYRVSVTF